MCHFIEAFCDALSRLSGCQYFSTIYLYVISKLLCYGDIECFNLTSSLKLNIVIQARVDPFLTCALDGLDLTKLFPKVSKLWWGKKKKIRLHFGIGC